MQMHSCTYIHTRAHTHMNACTGRAGKKKNGSEKLCKQEADRQAHSREPSPEFRSSRNEELKEKKVKRALKPEFWALCTHTCNPSAQEAGAKRTQFEASLDHS